MKKLIVQTFDFYFVCRNYTFFLFGVKNQYKRSRASRINAIEQSKTKTAPHFQTLSVFQIFIYDYMYYLKSTAQSLDHPQTTRVIKLDCEFDRKVRNWGGSKKFQSVSRLIQCNWKNQSKKRFEFQNFAGFKIFYTLYIFILPQKYKKRLFSAYLFRGVLWQFWFLLANTHSTKDILIKLHPLQITLL